MSKENSTHLLRLHSAVGVGDTTLRKLIRSTHDIEATVYEVEQGTLLGIKPKGSYPMISPKEAEVLYAKLQEKGIVVCSILDSEYPRRLNDLYDPPPILYIRGEYDHTCRSLGVVGTRRYSPYGKRVVDEIIPELSRHGVTIISGMALGIDTFVHQRVLASNGVTGVVLGSGVDVPAPVQNTKLYHSIVDTGFVVSEFPPGTQPARHTFPQRNRVIAALSDAIFVVEAGESSGALITVDYALDLGKDVYATPGSVFSPSSVGTNQLIQKGAKLVTGVHDILEDVFPCGTIASADLQPTLDNPLHKEIFDLLSIEPSFIDDILEGIKKPDNEVLSALSTLEVRGIIHRLEGDYFSR